VCPNLAKQLTEELRNSEPRCIDLTPSLVAGGKQFRGSRARKLYMSAQVKIQVHEGEPGIIVALFVVPPDKDEERRLFLDRALKQWLESHPRCEVEAIKPLRRNKKTYGLGVFLQPRPISINLTVKVAPELLERYGREYIEALMTDAAGLFKDNRLTDDLMAMISRREIAVLVQRKEELTTIVPLDEVRSYLSVKHQKDLDRWLQGGEFGYFVAPITK
jgi:hypothetical protein